MRQRNTLASVPALGSLLRAAVSRGAIACSNSCCATVSSSAAVPPGTADPKAMVRHDGEVQPEGTAEKSRQGNSVSIRLFLILPDDGGSRGRGGLFPASRAKGPGGTGGGEGKSYDGEPGHDKRVLYTETIERRWARARARGCWSWTWNWSWAGTTTRSGRRRKRS